MEDDVEAYEDDGVRVDDFMVDAYDACEDDELGSKDPFKTRVSSRENEIAEKVLSISKDTGSGTVPPSVISWGIKFGVVWSNIPESHNIRDRVHAMFPPMVLKCHNDAARHIKNEPKGSMDFIRFQFRNDWRRRVLNAYSELEKSLGMNAETRKSVAPSDTEDPDIPPGTVPTRDEFMEKIVANDPTPKGVAAIDPSEPIGRTEIVERLSQSLGAQRTQAQKAGEEWTFEQISNTLAYYLTHFDRSSKEKDYPDPRNRITGTYVVHAVTDPLVSVEELQSLPTNLKFETKFPKKRSEIPLARVIGDNKHCRGFVGILEKSVFARTLFMDAPTVTIKGSGVDVVTRVKDSGDRLERANALTLVIPENFDAGEIPESRYNAFVAAHIIPGTLTVGIIKWLIERSKKQKSEGGPPEVASLLGRSYTIKQSGPSYALWRNKGRVEIKRPSQRNGDVTVSHMGLWADALQQVDINGGKRDLSQLSKLREQAPRSFQQTIVGITKSKKKTEIECKNGSPFDACNDPFETSNVTVAWMVAASLLGLVRMAAYIDRRKSKDSVAVKSPLAPDALVTYACWTMASHALLSPGNSNSRVPWFAQKDRKNMPRAGDVDGNEWTELKHVYQRVKEALQDYPCRSDNPETTIKDTLLLQTLDIVFGLRKPVPAKPTKSGKPRKVKEVTAIPHNYGTRYSRVYKELKALGERLSALESGEQPAPGATGAEPVEDYSGSTPGADPRLLEYPESYGQHSQRVGKGGLSSWYPPGSTNPLTPQASPAHTPGRDLRFSPSPPRSAAGSMSPPINPGGDVLSDTEDYPGGDSNEESDTWHDAEATLTALEKVVLLVRWVDEET